MSHMPCGAGMMMSTLQVRDVETGPLRPSRQHCRGAVTVDDSGVNPGSATSKPGHLWQVP